MNRLKLSVMILLSILVMGVTGIRPSRTYHIQVIGNAGGTVACNANLWTGWIQAGPLGRIHLLFDFTDTGSDATTSAINMRCETYNYAAVMPVNDAGRDLHGTDGGAFAAGALTLTSGILTWTNPMAAGAPNSESWTWTVANIPSEFINCLITCTGGDADDDIRAYYVGQSP